MDDARRNGSIIILDERQSEDQVIRARMAEQLDLSDLNAKGNDIAIKPSRSRTRAGPGLAGGFMALQTIRLCRRMATRGTLHGPRDAPAAADEFC